MFSIGPVVIVASAIILAILLIGAFVSRLYRRATQNTAFVRTGFGGAKVIVEGGAIVLPVLHEISAVSLNTHKLEVSRKQSEALITKDSLRADVTVEFFVRVEKTDNSIKVAAQTLGDLTNDPTELKRLVEGKFVDALRSVAATMELSELHKNRGDFAQKVRQAAEMDLMKNGLELESASLVNLDQTDPKYFNPSNSFDAAGLAKITQITESKRLERFEIQATTDVEIAQRESTAKQRTYELNFETKNAEITQDQKTAEAEAKRMAFVSQKNSEAELVSAQARIDTQKQIETAEIQKKQDTTTAEQNMTIVVAKNSQNQSIAQAEAARERAKAAKAEEDILTVAAVAVAERHKDVELVGAKLEAERKSIAITVNAQAEKDAAILRGEATRTQANALADAERTQADAKERTYAVEAKGQQQINEARNILSDRVIEMQIRLHLIDNLPKIIEQSVKPLDNIDSIRIVDVAGLNGVGTGASGGEDGNAAGSMSFPDQVVASSLRHRTLAPLVDSLLQQAGLSGGGSLDSLTNKLIDGKPSVLTEVDSPRIEAAESSEPTSAMQTSGQANAPAISADVPTTSERHPDGAATRQADMKPRANRPSRAREDRGMNG